MTAVSFLPARPPTTRGNLTRTLGQGGGAALRRPVTRSYSRRRDSARRPPRPARRTGLGRGARTGRAADPRGGPVPARGGGRRPRLPAGGRRRAARVPPTAVPGAGSRRRPGPLPDPRAPDGTVLLGAGRR